MKPDRDHYLNKSDVFCMAPWTHLHFIPSGDALPCCFTHMDKHEALGNLNKDSIETIWNADKTRKLRKDMLTGKKNPYCEFCYVAEKAGAKSSREFFNKTFPHHFDKIATTKPDGRVDKINMAYLDLRFSNVCNFRCRMCTPKFSNSLYDDFVKLNREVGKDKNMKLFADESQMFKQMEPFIDHIEEIYFAGGEPLLMDEHYAILNYLIKYGKNKIRLKYSTNFSNLNFKNHDCLDLWNNFENVTVMASLDGMGKRGEILRKGQIWSEIEENRNEMIKRSPATNFVIVSTLNAMNCLHLPDFHREWVEKGLIGAASFSLNILNVPACYNIKIYPKNFKKAVEVKYKKHIEDFLKPNWKPGNGIEQVVRSFEAAILFMNEEDLTEELPMFKENIGNFNIIQDVNFHEAFPELAPLIS